METEPQVTPSEPGLRALWELPTRWRQKAQQLLPYSEAAARAFESAAADLVEALAREGDQRLTLQDASRASGYSVDHLARLVRSGSIPNAGRRHAPRIRSGDLPRKATVAGRSASRYDPAADARVLLSARREDQ